MCAKLFAKELTTELSHSAIFAKVICALTVARAPPLRAATARSHQTFAPNDNVQALSFYDFRGRMVTAVEKTSGGTTLESVTFTYDALDNRIGMDENSTQTWTLYEGSNPVIDFNSSGSLTMRYLWGPTGIVARQTSAGTVSWYLADHLGTVRDIINNSGSIIDHVDFSAFGTVLGETSPTNGDRFTGFAMLERDTTTGLNLAVHREENPGTGRWVSQDPLGFSAYDTDLFRYASNQPTDHSDKEGEGFWIPVIIIIALLINPTPLETPGGDNIAVLGILVDITTMVTIGPPVFRHPGGPWCFVAGTLVSTEDAPRPIEEILSGQRVWSYDFGSAEWFLRRVLSTTRRQYEGDIVTIAMGQEQIRATGNHPFWVTEGVDLQGRPNPEHVEPEEPGSPSGRWVDARDLVVGDILKSRNGSRTMVLSLHSANTYTDVFNLNVEELNNYSVGEVEILVHNRPAKIPGGSNPGGTTIRQRWGSRSPSNPAFQNNCVEVAKKIKGHIGGDIKRIRPGEGGFFGAIQGTQRAVELSRSGCEGWASLRRFHGFRGNGHRRI